MWSTRYTVKMKHSHTPGSHFMCEVSTLNWRLNSNGKVWTQYLSSAQASRCTEKRNRVWIHLLMKTFDINQKYYKISCFIIMMNYLINKSAYKRFCQEAPCILRGHALTALCSKCSVKTWWVTDPPWHLWLITSCKVPVINLWTCGSDEFYTVPRGTGTFHYMSYYCFSLLMA